MPTAAEPTNAIQVFYSYAPEDEELLDKLEKQLSILRRQGLIASWHKGKVGAGEEAEREIETHLKTADLILLLVSDDFLASDSCYSVEMQGALQRHKAGNARVIPIILRPVDWTGALFSKLKPLPKDGKPITSWANRDEAFYDVAGGIRKAVEELNGKRLAGSLKPSGPLSATWGERQTLPPAWNVPYQRNPFFTGREDVLSKLHNALAVGKTAALTQPHAISGLGGIGKTQTAVEYAYRYAGQYQAVLWARAETRETLNADFVTLADLLNLLEKGEQAQSRVVAAVKRWLVDHTGWLLILDNADDLLMARDFLPPTARGHILLTTRAQAMGGVARRVEIEKMGPEEGVLFLLRRANFLAPDATIDKVSMADRTKAREIVQTMDGLPLALDQAGAYIEECGISLADYLDIYQKRRTALLKRRGRMAAHHPDPVATTWSLSFQKIVESNPAAAELLRLCAFLAPDAIPEELITEGASELGPNLQAAASDPFEWNAGIEALLSFSLVERHPEDKTLSIHRLVQEVLKDGMDESTQRAWAECTVRAVNSIFPSPKFENWSDCQRYLPHAQVCAELIKQWNLTFDEAARLLNQVGYYLSERAQYGEAEPLLQRAIAIGEKTLGAEHPALATRLNNLAVLYANQGKYGEAEPLYQRAFAIYEKTFGMEHPDTLTVLSNYASLLQKMNREDEAAELEARAEEARARRDQEK